LAGCASTGTRSSRERFSACSTVSGAYLRLRSGHSRRGRAGRSSCRRCWRR
jgi:hypothetical protein